MKTARLFLAIDPTDVEKQALSCISQELRARFGEGRVNTWDMYHITLHFFEEVPEDRIEDIKRVMKKAASARCGFSLVTGGPGLFSSEDSAVVWVGISEGLEELNELHMTLEKLLGKAGFLEENRPYTPHITLGREVDVRGIEPPVRDIELASVNLQARGVTLLESRLVDGKPAYVPLATASFKR